MGAFKIGLYLVVLILTFHHERSLAETFFEKGELVGDKREMFKGIDLYFSYWIAGDIESNSGYFTTTISELGFSRYYLPAIGVRYHLVENDGFGFNVGVRYEFDREIRSISVSTPNQQQKLELADPIILSLSLIEANITHSIDGAYCFGGANFPLVSFSDKKTEPLKMAGDVGYQAGLGWDWHHNISNIKTRAKINFEVLYQTLRFHYEESHADKKIQSWSGAGLRLGFTY